MKRTKLYRVDYKMYEYDKVHEVYILAYNKADAYDIAVFETIPMVTGSIPYSAWVTNREYKNGIVVWFNNHEGNPY